MILECLLHILRIIQVEGMYSVAGEALQGTKPRNQIISQEDSHEW
jgi:hypothetical protein